MTYYPAITQPQLSQMPVAGTAMKQVGHTVTGRSEAATRFGAAGFDSRGARGAAGVRGWRGVLARVLRAGVSGAGTPPSAGAEPAQR